MQQKNKTWKMCVERRREEREGLTVLVDRMEKRGYRKGEVMNCLLIVWTLITYFSHTAATISKIQSTTRENVTSKKNFITSISLTV